MLHHREKIGQLGRVLLFIDGSKSMSVDDAQMMPGPRKLLVAQENGWLPEGTVDTTLAEAADSISAAQGKFASSLRGSKLTVETFLNARAEFKSTIIDVREKTENLTVEPPEPEIRGGVLYREVWESIGGGSVQNLTSNKKFKEEPDTTEYISDFDAPRNVGDNYGQRISGFLIPPLTGEYTLELVSDDDSALYISINNPNPSRRKQIASNRSQSRSTYVVQLKAETPTYIELLMKEGTGEDYATVSWTLPNGEVEKPIPSNRLASPSSGANKINGDFQTLAKRHHDNLLRRIEPRNLPKPDDSNASERLRAILLSVNSVVQEYESLLRNAFLSQGEVLAESGDTQIRSALDKFDEYSRWERTRNFLARDGGLLSEMVETHDVEVFLLKGAAAERLWVPGDTSEDLPIELKANADDPITDLATGVRKSLSTDLGGDAKETLDPNNSAQRTAVVLFSDGLHNDGESPLHTAKLLGARDITLNTVGLGGTTPPPDLAILEVKNPDAVFVDDRINGTLLLKD
ncbi:MAG: PA14 domain-containing protein, partial [Opitutae bacterium]